MAFPPAPASLGAAVQTWPFDLDALPADCWLVGGAVRDLLLGRQSTKPDLDFIVFEPALDLARRFAQCQGGAFVPLDPQRQIARVVLPQLTVDFARCEGDRLEQDLQRRDYTINAIAYQPRQQVLCDPCGGLTDLSPGRLRMIRRDNLAADPLRLLRAFRQSAQLGFPIDPDTLAAIAELAPHLAEVAAERVLAELQQLLHQPTPWDALHESLRLGVLRPWFPQARPERLVSLTEAEMQLTEALPALATQLDRLPSQSPWSLRALARFTTLLSPSPPEAEATLQHLKVSRSLLRQSLTLVQTQAMLPEARRGQLEARFHLYRRSGDLLPAALLLANPGPDLLPLAEAWLQPGDRVAHPPTWVDGKQLMQALDLPPGPRIGELLEAIALATARGEIDSPEAAIACARRQLTPNPA